MALPRLVKTGHRGIRQDPDSGDYWIDLTVAGQRLRENTGKRLKVALSRLSKVRTEMEELAARSLEERRARKLRAKEITLEELVAQVRAETESTIRESTARRYRVSDSAIVKGLGKDTWVSGLQPKELADFMARRAAEVKPATVNRDMQRLGALLDVAVRDRVLPRNPLGEIKKTRLPEPEPRKRVLTPDEQRRLELACGPLVWNVVEFALRTGIRLGQVLALRWSQLHEAHIHLDTSTKTAKKRSIPITPKVAAILVAQRGRHRVFVFPGPKRVNAWNKHNFLERHFSKAVEAAGIADFKFHDLRHTFASRMVERGADISEVQELIGHTQVEMTRKYVHHSKPHLTRIMEAAEQAEETVAHPEPDPRNRRRNDTPRRHPGIEG